VAAIREPPPGPRLRASWETCVRSRRWVHGARALGILGVSAALGALVAATLGARDADQPVSVARGPDLTRAAPLASPAAAVGPALRPLPASSRAGDQAAVSVRASDGRILPAAGVVSFTGVSREADALVFCGVSVLGGQVTAERIVVPDSGFGGARVDGLRVNGSRRPVGENLLYRLRGGGYVVVLQEAVSGGRQGLVALRVHTARGLGGGGLGGDVLVGASPTRAGGNVSVLALGPSSAPPSGQDGGYPLAVRGVVVGCPFVPGSTHSPTAPPDNLASDNAVDLAVPVGTPVLAVTDGTIGSLIGPLDSNDPHLAGLRVHLDGAADRFYYAHLSRIDVVPGQHVLRGQTIGLSGEAAGVAHLHFAEDLGDPAVTVGEPRACPPRPRPNEPWG
jgi:hypothetical protein